MSNELDFRLLTSYCDHPKIVKMLRLLGDKAIRHHLWLLAFVRQQKPRGILTDMDNLDIACAARWEGDADKYVETMRNCGLIDESPEGYVIHDWKEVNAWAYHAPERSQRAQDAANARWGKQNECDEDASSNATSNAKCNAPSPIPIPIPSPKDIVALYHEHCPSMPRVLKIESGMKRWDQIKKWVKFYSDTDWVKFFKSIEASDWLAGRVSPREGCNQFIADIDFIFTNTYFPKILEGKYDNKKPKRKKVDDGGVPR